MAPPISNHARKAAMERGETRFHGEPCSHGHPGLRYTKSYACVACCKEKSAERKARIKQNKRFFKGKPCRYGHGTTKYASTGVCIHCSSARSAARYLKRKNTGV